MKIAVITGASSGMGREFALQITQKETFDEIWVIARRKERLDELKEQLSCPVRVLPMDLTNEAALDNYSALLEQEKPEIDLLINAGGYGKFGRYDQIPLEDCMGMIDLNCKALVAMTQRSLPYIPQGGRILQVDSLSAFQPVPYLNVYAATKAFVLSYSQGLKAELKDRNIQVLAFCPGWVTTEFFDHAYQTSRDAVTYFNKVFTAEEVVRDALKALKKGKDVCVPSKRNKLQVFGVKHLPTRFVIKTWMRQQKHKS